MKKALFFLFSLILLPVFTVSAQEPYQGSIRPWWYTLEQGKQYFRSGSYGDALMAFEDARRDRLAQFTRMEQDFIALLSQPDLRRLGDSLEFVEMYIASHHEAATAAVLAELYHRIPKETLNNSVKRVLEELNRLKDYPEAEYWLGETYRVEGELALALRQYQRAFDERALLETPGFDTEILYKITDAHRVRGEYQEMEKRATEIIEGAGSSGASRDSLWTGDASNPGSVNQIRVSMARVMDTEGVNRFLTLYRYNNPLTEKAHRLLGFYCYASNRYSPAAEHLMFSFLIQNTVIIEELLREQYDFTFSTLGDLMDAVQKKPELSSYLDGAEYYKTIYYLASALYASGKTLPAMQLWTFLAGSNNSGEWGRRARQNPTPFIDRAIEMP